MEVKEKPIYRINGNPTPSDFVLDAVKDLLHELTPEACIDLVSHRLMITPDPPSPFDLYSGSEETERIREYVAERNAVNNAIVNLIFEFEAAYQTKFVGKKIPAKKSAE